MVGRCVQIGHVFEIGLDIKGDELHSYNNQTQYESAALLQNFVNRNQRASSLPDEL